MREYVATAKTVEEAIQLGCEALSVDRDDLGGAMRSWKCRRKPASWA